MTLADFLIGDLFLLVLSLAVGAGALRWRLPLIARPSNAAAFITPESNPIVVLGIVLLMSIAEELVFRVIPGAWSLSWTVGMVLAVCFSLAHDLRRERRGWNCRTLPIPQLLAGLWYWYGLRQLGPWAPLLAHCLDNFIVVGGILLVRAWQRRGAQSGPAAAADLPDNASFGDGVTEEDLKGWLEVDRARLTRLLETRDGHGDPLLLEGEIDMVQATVRQFEAELRYVDLCKQRSRVSGMK